MLQINSESTWITDKVAVGAVTFMCSNVQDLGQVSMSPNPIREITRMDQHMPRFVSSILCYLDYLKSVFIQTNAFLINIKVYFYIIFYFIVLILFYFIFLILLILFILFYFINIILYCYIIFLYLYQKHIY